MWRYSKPATPSPPCEHDGHFCVFTGCRSMLSYLGVSVATSHGPTGLPAFVSSHRDGTAPMLVSVSAPEEKYSGGDHARGVGPQGRTSFLHESSLVTLVTRPRRQTSRPCSERWVQSQKSFCQSTVSPIDREGSPSWSSGMPLPCPRRSRNSTAPSSTDEISGSARPVTVRHDHPVEAAGS